MANAAALRFKPKEEHPTLQKLIALRKKQQQ